MFSDRYLGKSAVAGVAREILTLFLEFLFTLEVSGYPASGILDHKHHIDLIKSR